jgi:hypothetical protein
VAAHLVARGFYVEPVPPSALLLAAGAHPSVPIAPDLGVEAVLSLRLPPELWGRLMPFQQEGVRFAIARGGRALIADEMCGAAAAARPHCRAQPRCRAAAVAVPLATRRLAALRAPRCLPPRRR